MKTIILLGTAAVALLAVPTLAQQGRPEMTRAGVETAVRDTFARVDTNRDGNVTQAEAQAVHQARRAERQEDRSERRSARFARLDANRDGSISRAEFDAPRMPRPADRADRRENRTERRAERRDKRMERRAQRGGFVRFGAKAFARLDADKDSRVSLAEATAGALRRFDRLDTNRDGTVTREERRAVRAARQADRG